MDFGRKPYKAKCRFWRNSDAVGTVRWYEVQPDAPTLGMTSVIYRREWDNDQYNDVPVGELPDERKRFLAGFVPRGLPGVHVCGKDLDFDEGGEYVPGFLPVRYSVSGWPLCCDPPVTLRGGAGAGGRVHPTLVPGGTCGGVTLDCVGSVAGSLNKQCHYNLLLVFGGWLRWAVTPGVPVRVRIDQGASGRAYTYTVYEGADCGSLSGITSGLVVGAPVLEVPFVPTAPYVWIHFAPSGVTAWNFTASCNT